MIDPLIAAIEAVRTVGLIYSNPDPSITPEIRRELADDAIKIGRMILESSNQTGDTKGVLSTHVKIRTDH